MIKRDFLLTVSGETSKLNNNLYIYQGDFGIELSFNIVGLNYNFDNSSTDIVRKYKPTYSSVRYKKPNSNIEYNTDRVTISVDDNRVRFTITQDMADEITEIGVYKVQIRLYDKDNNVLTIPPFTFLVKPLINNPMVVDEDKTDNGTTGDDDQANPNNPDYGNDLENKLYNYKHWVAGEIVRAYDLNRMEEAINYLVVEGSGGGDASIDDDYIGVDKTWSSTKIYNFTTDGLEQMINNDPGRFKGEKGDKGDPMRYWVGTIEEYNKIVHEDNILYLIIQ